MPTTSEHRTSRRLAVAAAAAAATLLVAVGCETPAQQTFVTWTADGTPVHEDPVEAVSYHQVVFYPRAQAYFEPYSRTYWWYANDQWNEGPVLPRRLAFLTEEPIVVHVDALPPCSEHAEFLAAHAPKAIAVPGSDHAVPTTVAGVSTPTTGDAATAETTDIVVWTMPTPEPTADPMSTDQTVATTTDAGAFDAAESASATGAEATTAFTEAETGRTAEWWPGWPWAPRPLDASQIIVAPTMPTADAIAEVPSASSEQR